MKTLLLILLVLYTNIKMPDINYTKTKYIINVNFGLPGTAKRLWLIDNSTGKVILNTYVAHGRGSGTKYATKFSNRPGSFQSSLGKSLTAEIYEGVHGKSINLDGLDKSNDKMRERRIVIHSATYIENGKGGRSLGCFAVPKKDMEEILKYASKGPILVNAYVLK